MVRKEKNIAIAKKKRRKNTVQEEMNKKIEIKERKTKRSIPANTKTKILLRKIVNKKEKEIDLTVSAVTQVK